MEKQIGNDELVWYVAYGSNLSSKRFQEYLGKIQHKGLFPISLPFSIPFDIYFDRHSPRWDQSGVAFLNTDKPGFAYGKAYLITFQQFLKIQSQEGWYPKIISLGLLDNLPTLSFTQMIHKTGTIPSQKYLKVILEGLIETYPTIELSIFEDYLQKRVKSI
jgi:hypothetical protein